MKIKISELKKIIKESFDSSPPMGSWIWFPVHAGRIEQPVKIVDIDDDKIKIGWGPYWNHSNYQRLIDKDLIMMRQNQQVMNDDHPDVIEAQKPLEPTSTQVYGGDPYKNPWGLGT